MFKIKTLSFLLLAGILFTTEISAQDLHPSRRPSPLGMARTFVGNTYVKVTFSQPYTRGRDNIFGESADVMHPNGKVWRFGANEPTELSFDGPLKVGDTVIEGGTYSVFVTPGAETWMVHLNDFRGGAATEYKADKNVVSIGVPRKTLDEAVDQLVISFEDVGAGVQMVASWTQWEIRVPIMPAE